VNRDLAHWLLIGFMLSTIGVACGRGKATEPITSAPAQQNGDQLIRARIENQNQKTQLEAYRGKVKEELQLMSEGVNTVQPLAADPKFGDIYWEAHLRDGLASWKAIYKEAAALTEPDGYEGFHAKYLESLRSLNTDGDHVLAGLQPPDVDRVKVGADEILRDKKLLV
jgi:hypothetical protein